MDELTKAINGQNNLLTVQIKYQKKLCDQQKEILDENAAWRAKWWRSKVLDTKLTFVGLAFLIVGFYTEFLHADFSVFAGI